MLDLSSYLELELALTFLFSMIDDIQIWSQSCVFLFIYLFIYFLLLLRILSILKHTHMGRWEKFLKKLTVVYI